MAPPRRPRGRTALLAFDALTIVGGLLSPEWLSKVAQLAAGTQTEADYGIPKGLNLRDELARSWRIAQAHWFELTTGRAAGADPAALAERFVTGLLRDALGFTTLTTTAPVDHGDRSYPIGHVALGGRVPVVIAPTGDGLEKASTAFGDDGRRRTAFGLAQEYLNAQDGALWGVVTDGAIFRVLRDNASLTRPAWIEVDLTRIFAEERYADFTALWLLCHQSRFGRVEQPVTACALETWRDAGREQGTRAREHLRLGVEEALVALGQGFLGHPDNVGLRTDLQRGALTARDYQRQLLRLVYRLIFLLTAEERELLHPDDDSDDARAARALYAQGYGVRRLRERSVKRSAHDRFSDLWEGVKVVLRGLATGEPRLGLPALAGIFAAHQCPALDGARLENRALLLAVFKLAWLKDQGSLARVNWRDMGPEELGSVYEGLLELEPQVTENARQFGFATGGTKGNARKTSGSYYTPDSLVQVLLDSALDPVIAAAVARDPGAPVEALLALTIVDPACGSGHFLLAAARRLASHVARWQVQGTPTDHEYRLALRQVVSRCIFGVDLNPMAVELCKVSLWLEAMDPQLPLSFLDSHIQHGNALLGATPELLAAGIPDAAWEPLEGDDRKIASALKKRNKAERTDHNAVFEFSRTLEGGTVAIRSQVQTLDAAPDTSVGDLDRKASSWAGILASLQYRAHQLAADAWCAAFVWKKEAGELAKLAPTHRLWEELRHEPDSAEPGLVAEVERLAVDYHFFHWHLRFPQVFGRGGFDVVLGNPPWERVKLQEQEFFATRDGDIAGAANAAARKRLIAQLPTTNRALWDEWTAASRRAEGESHVIRNSGRYPLCGKGDVNTYAIFAEHNRTILGARGRAGFIVPAGLVTDETTKEFFADLVGSRFLAAVFHFENEEKLFPQVHNAFRFVLIALGPTPLADLAFFLRQPSAVADPERHFTLSLQDFETLNPNTRTCPTFRSKRDADINLGVYRRVGILVRDDDADGNPWGLRFLAMMHMANDSSSFRTAADLDASGWKLDGNVYAQGQARMLPLIEGKMVHHFDHRAATYEGATEAHRNKGTLPELSSESHTDPHRRAVPNYWCAETCVEERLAGRWQRNWLLGWRDITGTEKERTVIASLFPRSAVANTMPLMFPGPEPQMIACLYAFLCSFAFDYAARQKVGGTHLTYNYLKQLPALSPAAFDASTPWNRDTSLRDWMLQRVLELTYTAWDLEPFARDVGYEGPPFLWDPARRFQIRSELDAAFFHLYGLSRDDTGYIIDSFPIVRKHDEKAHGEYRTRRVILEIYDALARAAVTGVPFVSPLGPPRSVA